MRCVVEPTVQSHVHAQASPCRSFPFPARHTRALPSHVFLIDPKSQPVLSLRASVVVLPFNDSLPLHTHPSFSPLSHASSTHVTRKNYPSTIHPPFVENQALPLRPPPVACMPTGPVVPLYTLPVFTSTFYLRVSKLLDPFVHLSVYGSAPCLSSLFSLLILPIISSD